jgi:hypothetical protein
MNQDGPWSCAWKPFLVLSLSFLFNFINQALCVLMCISHGSLSCGKSYFVYSWRCINSMKWSLFIKSHILWNHLVIPSLVISTCFTQFQHHYPYNSLGWKFRFLFSEIAVLFFIFAIRISIKRRRVFNFFFSQHKSSQKSRAHSFEGGLKL